MCTQLPYAVKDDPLIKIYRQFASGSIQPWMKLAMVVGIACLGRKIEIHNPQFSDFERVQDEKNDELRITLEVKA